MSDDAWNAVRAAMGQQRLALGPYFSEELLNSPRHLLFTLARYKFAAKMLPQDRTVDVLELGCSEGLASLLLAEHGNRVVGVDFDADAVAHAQETLTRDNLSFIHADFVGSSFGQFDAVVSLDVIEHVATEREDAFMRTVVGNLKPDGFCVIGTPNDSASQYASPHSQIGHVNMYTAERLSAVVGMHFANVFTFGMNDEMVHTGFYPMCHYLVALGCGPRKPA